MHIFLLPWDNVLWVQCVIYKQLIQYFLPLQTYPFQAAVSHLKLLSKAYLDVFFDTQRSLVERERYETGK